MTAKYETFMAALKVLCAEHDVEIINAPWQKKVMVFDMSYDQRPLSADQFEDCTNE